MDKTGRKNAARKRRVALRPDAGEPGGVDGREPVNNGAADQMRTSQSDGTQNLGGGNGDRAERTHVAAELTVAKDAPRPKNRGRTAKSYRRKKPGIDSRNTLRASMDEPDW